MALGLIPAAAVPLLFQNLRRACERAGERLDLLLLNVRTLRLVCSPTKESDTKRSRSTERFFGCGSGFDPRPSGYEADQKENIGSLDFNHLHAKSLISLDYLAALNRNRRMPL
jgi:hypothetical protein